MMATAQAQSSSSEDQVRDAIASAISAHGGQVQVNQPGSLVVDVGGPVGLAYLAGPFRSAMKMPLRVTVATTTGPSGTGLGIEVGGRGTGGGFASGGVFGKRKHDRAEQAWLAAVLAAIPRRVS
jgi:hypothetical protein